jgi:hypothetical protein
MKHHLNFFGPNGVQPDRNDNKMRPQTCNSARVINNLQVSYYREKLLSSETKKQMNSNSIFRTYDGMRINNFNRPLIHNNNYSLRSNHQDTMGTIGTQGTDLKNKNLANN